MDQWNRTIQPTLSQDQFESKVKRVLRSKLSKYYDYYSDTRLKTDFDRLRLDYAQQKSYDVKGDKLTIKVKNAKGQVIEKSTYRKVSETRAQELQKLFGNIRSQFEDNYGVQ